MGYRDVQVLLREPKLADSSAASLNRLIDVPCASFRAIQGHSASGSSRSKCKKLRLPSSARRKRTPSSGTWGKTGVSDVWRSFESGAAGESKVPENRCGGAEAGKGSLKHIEAYESHKKPEPGRDQKSQEMKIISPAKANTARSRFMQLAP